MRGLGLGSRGPPGLALPWGAMVPTVRVSSYLDFRVEAEVFGAASISKARLHLLQALQL